SGGTVLTFGGFSTDMYKTTFDDCQSPAATTWDKKPLLSASTTRAAGDPILFTDNLLGRTFVAQLEALTPAGSTIDITDNDGDMFVPSDGLPPRVSVTERLGAAPSTPPLPAGTPLNPNAAYYPSQTLSVPPCPAADTGASP